MRLGRRLPGGVYTRADHIPRWRRRAVTGGGQLNSSRFPTTDPALGEAGSRPRGSHPSSFPRPENVFPSDVFVSAAPLKRQRRRQRRSRWPPPEGSVTLPSPGSVLLPHAPTDGTHGWGAPRFGYVDLRCAPLCGAGPARSLTLGALPAALRRPSVAPGCSGARSRLPWLLRCYAVSKRPGDPGPSAHSLLLEVGATQRLASETGKHSPTPSSTHQGPGCARPAGQVCRKATVPGPRGASVWSLRGGADTAPVVPKLGAPGPRVTRQQVTDAVSQRELRRVPEHRQIWVSAAACAVFP